MSCLVQTLTDCMQHGRPSYQKVPPYLHLPPRGKVLFLQEAPVSCHCPHHDRRERRSDHGKYTHTCTHLLHNKAPEIVSFAIAKSSLYDSLRIVGTASHFILMIRNSKKHDTCSHRPSGKLLQFIRKTIQAVTVLPCPWTEFLPQYPVPSITNIG